MMNTIRVYGRKVNIHTANGWVKVKTMKLKECKDWKKVIFDDRSILKVDLSLMCKWQIDSLMNLEVVSTKRKGVYKAK